MAIRQLFLNGQVVTMNAQAPEATAFAILGERFCAVGVDDEIRQWADNQTEISI